MELLAYIHEEFIQSTSIDENDVELNQNLDQNLNLKFENWFKQLMTKSAKLSLSVILAGTTILVGLGSTLKVLAIEPPSSEIKYVQSLLSQNGFDPGAIDGVAGISTKNAILRAQKELGLTPDGVIGRQTITALEGKNNKEAAPRVSVDETTRSSSVVMNLQKLLSDRGFYNGAVDGLMGSRTRAAIIDAQKAYKLLPDGLAGAQTLAALEADSSKAIALPKAAEISKLQGLLSKRGFYNGAVDGVMGPQTRLATVAAQKSYGLVTDGIAGSQTLAALESGVLTPATGKTNATDASANPAPDPATQKSDKDIISLQQLLTQRGFYNGAIDGVKGSQTNAAIAAAQKAYGLTTDGIAGNQTIAALQSDPKPAAKPANTAIANDEGVANLQNLLADRGFYNGVVTGVLGSRTKEAIIAAQKAYGLTADGVAGSRTIAALESGAPSSQVVPAKPAVTTPAIRVETKPQIVATPIPQVTTAQPTAKPTAQPQIVPTPIPQVTVQPIATPKPTTPIASVPSNSAPNASANVQISELQSLLSQRGFYTGKIDGVLSGETRNAIIRAQNFYTITPADGSPSNRLVESLTKDTFISEGN